MTAADMKDYEKTPIQVSGPSTSSESTGSEKLVADVIDETTEPATVPPSNDVATWKRLFDKHAQRYNE